MLGPCLFLAQVVDFQDVSFQTLSSSKVLCAGAKPSASAPSKLLLLASKVISLFMYRESGGISSFLLSCGPKSNIWLNNLCFL